MKVICEWIVELPLFFRMGSKFKNTELTQYQFMIEDVNIELLINKETECIDRVRIVVEDEYDEKYLPSYEHYDYLDDFNQRITHKVGSTIQSFLDGFSRYTNDDNYLIFDGYDFVTEYQAEINPNILGSSGHNINEKDHRNFDDECLKHSIDFVTKEKTLYDKSWYILRDAETNLELGKYEICFLYLAIDIEMLFKTKLSKFLKDNGYFKDKHSKSIEDKYGKHATFVEKYILYGLSLITDKQLDEDIIATVDFIFKVRNKLAHGVSLYDIDIIKDYGINQLNIRNYLHGCLNKTSDVHNFLFDLELK